MINRPNTIAVAGYTRLPVPAVSAPSPLGAEPNDGPPRSGKMFSGATPRPADVGSWADPFLSATPFIVQFIAQERMAPPSVDPRQAMAAYARREERYAPPIDLIDAA